VPRQVKEKGEQFEKKIKVAASLTSSPPRWKQRRVGCGD